MKSIQSLFTPITLAALMLMSGCSIVNGIFGTHLGESEEPKGPTSLSEEDLAKADEVIEEHLTELTFHDSELEPWPDTNITVMRRYDDMLDLISSRARRYSDEGAQKKYREPRLAKVEVGYQEALSKAYAEAMEAGDPERALKLTSTADRLQTVMRVSEPRDLSSRLVEASAAITDRYRSLFAERAEYTKLNGRSCIVSQSPLGPFGEEQSGLNWSLDRGSEVHVRCIWPVTIASMITNGEASGVSAQAHAAGVDAETGKWVSREITIPLEFTSFWDKRYVEFAFDMEELTKGLEPGAIGIHNYVGNSGAITYVSFE